MQSKLFVHLLIVSFIFSILPSFAQRGGGSGKQDLSGSVIFEDVLNRPTDASTITLIHASGEIRQSGLDGSDSFTFKKCPNGSYTLQINAEGYEPKEVLFTVSADDYSLSWIPKLYGIPLKKKGSRMRTRTIDYTNWDKLQQTWMSNPNKTEAARLLIEEANRTFTPEDEEYYMAYKNAGFLLAEVDFNQAVRCYETAFEAKSKYYPFITRFSFPFATPQTIMMDIVWFSNAYAKFGLLSNAIQLLKNNQDIVTDLAPEQKVIYYSTIGSLLCFNQQYEEAITSVSPVKDIMESGQIGSGLNIQPLYKIDKDDPRYLQKSQANSNEEYAKTIQEINTRQQEIQKSIVVMQYYTVLADAYYNQYKWEQAIPYLKEQIHASRDMYTKLNASLSSIINENTPDSLKRLLQESSFFTSEFDYTWKLVNAYYKSGQTELAKESVNGALSNLIYNQLSGNFEECNRILSETESRITSEHFKKMLAPTKLYLAAASQVYATANNLLNTLLNEKEASLEKNFTYFSESQRKEFMREYGKLIDQYYSLSLSESKQFPEKAFGVLNKSLQTKGLILDITRAQQSKLNRVTDEQVIRDIDKIKALNRKVAALSAQNQQMPAATISDSIKANTLRMDELQRKVNQQLGTDTILKQVSWQDIQKRLQAGEVYVEIVKVNRDNFMYDAPEVQYWAFVILSGSLQPVAVFLDKEQSLEEVYSKNYLRTLQSKRADSLSYDMFWSKIQTACAGAKRMYLCAEGIYHRINPHTLKASSTAPYVLETAEVVKISTGRDLLKSSTVMENKSIALIGNAAFYMKRKTGENQHLAKGNHADEAVAEVTRSTYSELPGTLEEVKRIAEQAKAQAYSVELLEGTQATEANVKKLQKPGILHIATHGEFDKKISADSYLKSKLVLAGAADPEPFTIQDHELYEDGFLSAYEVTQMDLSGTYMVVLSACETGLGDVQGGEGVWGLQRAFQLAGANYVLTSLWQISDEATVSFMDALYKNYFAGNDIRTAYKTAMEETKKLFPQPYYWGAFILNTK